MVEVKNKMNFLQWVFSRPSYWIIVVLVSFFSIITIENFLGIGEVIGQLLGSMLTISIPYFIYWRGAKSKLAKKLR